MKRVTILVASLLVLATGAPTRAARAKEADKSFRCWLYCESYRMMCEQALRTELQYCEAFHEGCLEGCQYIP